MFLRLNYTHLFNASYFGICFGTTCVFLLRLAVLLLGSHSAGFPVLPLGEVPPRVNIPAFTEEQGLSSSAWSAGSIVIV